MKTRPKQRRVHPDTVVLIKQILLGIFVIVLIALLVVAVWYGTRLQALNIRTVEVSGGETISRDFVRSQVEEQLQGTYLRLIPRSFVYLYPEQDIQKALAGIERMKDITLEKKGGTTLAVTFSEYFSDALWCDADARNCFFIDDTGFAFSRAPELSGGAFLRFVSIGRNPELGQSVVTSNEYQILKATEDRLQTIGWEVQRIDIDSIGDAYITLAAGGELKISLAQTLEGTVGNLETVLTAENFADVAPGNFRYIDLRFGNKVFVNRSEEEVLVEDEGVLTSGDTGTTTTTDITANMDAEATEEPFEEIVTEVLAEDEVSAETSTSNTAEAE